VLELAKQWSNHGWWSSVLLSFALLSALIIAVSKGFEDSFW